MFGPSVSEYKNKPIEICLCFGGEVKEEVRPNVSMFLGKLKTNELKTLLPHYSDNFEKTLAFQSISSFIIVMKM